MSALAERSARVRPRPLFCPVAHLHADRAVAEAACAGRFRHAGVELELGLEPDWLADPFPDDEEWRIEWSKFSWGLDLASAFRETGEHRFLDAWERLVGSWLAAVPADRDPSEVTARRLQFWLYAWDAFASAPGFPGLAEGLEGQLVVSIAEQAAFVRANPTPERNHRTLELYTLFLVPLAFPQLDPDGTALTFAVEALGRDLHDAFRPDGVHRESSSHYHMIVLRSFLAVRETARQRDVALPGGYDPALERACDVALHLHRPDGGIPALSDADSGSYLDLLGLAAGLLDRPDYRYAATRGREGAAPQACSASFPAGGLFVQRGGWGTSTTSFEDERYLVFDCGPLGDGGHGHLDLLSVEIASGGRPLLVDPGRYTYAEGTPNLRRWFKRTAAHNTVLVDALDQTPYRRGKPKGPVAEATFLGRLRSSGLDVLAGEARSPSYEAVHRRTIVFVGGEYWLIQDSLRGTRAHRYEARFHLTAEAWGRVSVRQASVRAPGLALVAAPGVETQVEAGWVAPEYGVKHRAPVVSFAAEEAPDADIVTLVFPLRPGAPMPQLRIRRAGDTTAVEVRGSGRQGRACDLVTWGAGRASWQRRGDGR